MLLVALIGAASGSASAPARAARPIVIAAAPGAGFDLFAYEVELGSLSRLTSGSLDERAPALSPDGQKVAYISSDGLAYLVTLRPEMAEPERLPLPPGRWGRPAWAADGERIVLPRYRFSAEGENADLWLLRPATGELRPLLTQPGNQEQVAMSPDGCCLVFTMALGTVLEGFGARVHTSLWHLSLRNGRLRPLLLSEGEDRDAIFSPDGRQLAFASRRAGSFDLWRTDVEDGSLERLTTAGGAESQPAFSPDGQRLAYLSTDASGTRLGLLDLRTGETRLLEPFGRADVPIVEIAW